MSRRLSLSFLTACLCLTPPLTAQEPNFGRAIVASGNEMHIGQPVNWYGPGTVYSYRADANGQWREVSRTTASDTARMDDFGRAIAADGNTMVVGAPRKRDGAGVAYVFTRANATAPWREQAILEAPTGGEFGTAVVLEGNDLLISAPAADSTGVVHHFHRTTTGWALRGTLRPERSAGRAGFGAALSRAGDWLLIGAPMQGGGVGGAHVAVRTTDGRWGGLQPVTLPGNAAAASRRGSAVLLSGSRGYLGAPGAGVVITIAREGERWIGTGELHAFDAARGSQFGHAMAMVGEELWVGAPGLNRGNGTVYRFLPHDADGWRGAMRFDADSATGTAWAFGFGYAIAAAGNGAVVAMPSRDFGEGRVMVAASQGGAWRERQQLTGEIKVIGGGAAPAVRCTEGQIGPFTCNSMELVSHLPINTLGGERGAWVNDVWGWTDPATNRDYALVARRDGASFVEVTNPAAPRLVGNLPRTVGSPPSVWRDIKVLGNHAYIVADGAGAHGMQVFDLTRLRAVTGAPVTFAPDTTYREVFSVHNIAADTASKFLYLASANSGGITCGGGLHIVDARDQGRPVFAGCYHSPSATSRGGTHDAQCVIYRGPDTRYRGRELCIGSNESEINIADVTDKANPTLIGRNSYPNVAYAHQGWFDDEQRYFYMNDEIDELQGTVEGTRTIVWDLSQLDDPVVAHMYYGPVKSSDHNLFIVGDRMYQANYGSGLRVIDISQRTAPREIAFFDSAPFNNDEPGHSAVASGAWSVYPFFKSGVVVFTSVREGLFMVKVADLVP
jgi:choice-of-anchor B domain-containing protein